MKTYPKQRRFRKPLYAGVILFTVLAAFALPGFAQQPVPTSTPANPNANVSWPPPVYVLRGTETLRGTANLPNMSNYFFEFRPLNPDLSEQPDNAPWFPATLPQTAPVQSGVLGTWNTQTAPDGVYELRLTINISGGTPVFALISPLRIENNPPPFVTRVPPAGIATNTPAPQLPPTLAPTPVSTGPQVTALVDANVRKGDDTRYDAIGFLLKGDSAPILGISSFGTGWYYIQLKDGRRGFIAPTIVSVSGNATGLPLISPPPPPTPAATATPLPPPTPITAANLVITGLGLNPNPPVCNQTFTLLVTVTNVGTGPTVSSGLASVQDIAARTGTVGTTSQGGFPVLNPGQSFTMSIPLTVAIYYNEPHQIVIQIDPSNQIPETNKNDNTAPLPYTLQKGSCP